MYLKKFIYLQKPINTIVIVILQYKDIVIYTKVLILVKAQQNV